MPRFEIEELVVPQAVGAPGWDDFAASVAVRNAAEAAGYGTDDVTYPAEELLPGWQVPQEPHRLLVARVDGRIVARGVHETRLGEASDTAWVDIDVLPECAGGAEGAGRGADGEDPVADALFARIERIAREAGQVRLIAYQVSADAPGPRLDSPTGFGSVPADNPEVRQLRRWGFTLEQVERASRFALPADAADLAARRAAAQAAAGDDYVVHEWIGATPEHRREDLALLQTRMSTDAPTAGLDEPEDVWTVERLLAAEATRAGSPIDQLTAVVEHRPSGRLAGFTTLIVPHDPTRPVSQDDTLVLREHRGHRLGMLLKVVNLQHLERTRPGRPSVLTWNAEENRYMLGVNEAVGFVPIGAEGAWKKEL